MLFNSYEFIFAFLPIVCIVYFATARSSQSAAALWLAAASVFFYGWWNPKFVALLLASVCFNYGAGRVISRAGNGRARMALTLSIVVNLGVLGVFKYANFFVSTLNNAGAQFSLLDIILPAGISFFTFTQIAFLVDSYRGIAKEYNFIHYLLFVTWFPHLIAGPVLHHKQMMPQFRHAATYRINIEHVAVGLSIFILGLSKKVLIADNLAEYATPVFKAAGDGNTLMLFEAWVGALAYSLQLYFDFSGYSDMAVGLSLLFNVRLPLNFDSPYKAVNIIDFWRRWHMTLSAFLRDYLYVPLGGNRKGPARKYVNLMATMLLGGLWHGAGWTFVLWGGLHGLYLMINHGWLGLKARLGLGDGGYFARLFAGALTFLAVVVAWVFFRADSLTTAQSILAGMAGMNGLSLPASLADRLEPVIGKLPYLSVIFNGAFPNTHLSTGGAIASIAFGCTLVWFFPNVREIMLRYKPTWDDVAGKHPVEPASQGFVARRLNWQPSPVYAIPLGILFFACVVSLTKVSEFLYFQF
jgi:D-alanyl-lipoteichoic acid acyltransferase DltB (MBOAT superfamily)